MKFVNGLIKENK